MTTGALDFLEREAEPDTPGVWRFGSSRNELHDLYPPDLDDTCCASYALRIYGRRAPDNRALIVSNRDEQGRFRTWLASDSKAMLWLWRFGQQQNVDVAVNANVLSYLGERAYTVAAVSFVRDTIRAAHGLVCSSFYPDDLSAYYMVARAYANGVPALQSVGQVIVERTLALQHADGSFGTALQTGLAANVACKFGYRGSAIERAIGILLASQDDSGAWPAAPLFVDPVGYYGSAELTTAVCVEALASSIDALV